MLKILGENPNGKHKIHIEQSENFKNGAFENLEKTSVLGENVGFYKMMSDYFKGSPNRVPSKPIPSLKTNINKLKQSETNITWFGHSSYHILFNGQHVLVDPVFCGYASPFSGMIKAFEGSDIYSPEDFDSIDILLLTHDHYDHLDYKSLLKLKGKVKKIVCSLGVSSHLVYWGFNPQIIHELDWWENIKLEENMEITATPARHFSGRSFKRAQTLWSSFILKNSKETIFIGGDSGYGEHFKKIGENFPHIDIAILECGQYNEKWPLIHMLPEQVVQAHLDLKANILMPVHWGKFALAYHPWNEPVIRLIEKAANLKIDYATPRIGQAFQIGADLPNDEWWV